MGWDGSSGDFRNTQTPIVEGQLVDGLYRIVSEIGRGAHGTVFKAIDEVLHREVALKIVNDSVLLSNPQLQRRFQKEAKVLSTLDHPHVVQIFRTGLLADNSPYLVMEYLEGTTLGQLLKTKRLPIHASLEMAAAIASGMEHIHSCNVIHSDLKPENVMVDENDFARTKIFDFGISRILSGDVRLQETATGSIRGTVAYMSPEQARGENIDERSDIYSFSCMLFEMVTGAVPFVAETQAQILMKHLQQSAPQICSTRTSSRAEHDFVMKVNSFLQCGLNKEKEKRFQSFSALIQELNQLRYMVPAASSNQLDLTLQPRRADRIAGTNSKRMLVLAALGVAICLLSFFIWTQFGPAIQDDYYLSKVPPANSIPYFSRRAAHLLEEDDSAGALRLIDRTTNRFNASRWTKVERTELLNAYFAILKKHDQMDTLIRRETYKIAIELFSDLLHWGRIYHSSESHSNSDRADFGIWLDRMDNVGDYLWTETNRTGNWEPIAILFSKHPASLPPQNAQYFKTAALLRERAEETFPQKCGIDSDTLGEHCVGMMRILSLNPGTDPAEWRRETDRLVLLMERNHGQAKDLNLMHCEMALEYFKKGQFDLAEKHRMAIKSLGNIFGSRTDEVYPFMLMEAFEGLKFCKLKDKNGALKQLAIVEGTLHNEAVKRHNVRAKRGTGPWQRYSHLVALPGLKGDLDKFEYPFTKEQDVIADGDPGLSHAYRLRRAIIDTFGKESLKAI